MNTLTATGAECGLGLTIDSARAEAAALAKHRRPAIVVMAVEEYERLTAVELTEASASGDECNNWYPR